MLNQVGWYLVQLNHRGSSSTGNNGLHVLRRSLSFSFERMYKMDHVLCMLFCSDALDAHNEDALSNHGLLTLFLFDQDAVSSKRTYERTTIC